MFHRVLFACTVSWLVAFCAARGQAAISLADLVNNGGSLTVADKDFSNWSVLLNEFYGAPSNPNPTGTIDLSDVWVDELATLSLNTGLRFYTTNNALHVSDGQYLGLILSYNVSASQPIIKDNSLELIGYTLTVGGLLGFPEVYVGESLSNGGRDVFVVADKISLRLVDSAAFPAVLSHDVVTEIYVNTLVDGDVAELSEFHARFSQIEAVVPEPASFVGFLGLSATGLFIAGWRNRRKLVRSLAPAAVV